MFQYLGYLAVVLFFARNKEKSRKERLNAMSSMATSVAHELLTPLATLNIGAKNIKKYFPYFSQAYLMATQANLPVETINASTFKLKGKIFIWLETNKEHKLFFKDTGTGIAKEWIGRIFDRFYTQTPHGAGIGLTFYKAAMQFLGGEILCEYIQNEYTLFTLKFPKMIS